MWRHGNSIDFHEVHWQVELLTVIRPSLDADSNMPSPLSSKQAFPFNSICFARKRYMHIVSDISFSLVKLHQKGYDRQPVLFVPSHDLAIYSRSLMQLVTVRQFQLQSSLPLQINTTAIISICIWNFLKYDNPTRTFYWYLLYI